MQLNISPHPKQIEALKLLSNPEIEVLGYGGARGGGKSYLGRMWLVMRALKYSTSRHLLIRKTFPDLERSAIDKIKLEFAGIYSNYNERKKIFEFSNGSTIEMAYLQYDSDLDNYQGSEYDSVFIDESAQHTKRVFEILRLSLRTTNPEIKPRMLLCFNWGGTGHSWHKRLFWDKQYDEGMEPNHFAFLRATVHDNPSIFDNDPTYIKRLEALPESLRKLYLDGDPTGALGQFFTEFTTQLKEEPFSITRAQMEGRLFGSLDVGTTHSTAFDLWYIDDNQIIHKLFTYNQSGGTMSEHAQNIYDKIASFPYTNGYFPGQVWADPAAFTKSKLNAYMIRSPIDEYIDLFRTNKTITQFVKANNDRANGAQIMRNIFSQRKLRYFARYNQSFEDAVMAATVNPNDVESYLKVDTDEDNELDASRYGIVGCNTILATINQRNKSKPLTHMQAVLSGRYAKQSENSFWDSNIKHI